MVLGRRLVKQEAARELLAVELGKEVLVANVGQELHHLVEGRLDLVVAQLLGAALTKREGRGGEGSAASGERGGVSSEAQGGHQEQTHGCSVPASFVPKETELFSSSQGREGKEGMRGRTDGPS